jgi:hypothetical protein
MLCSEIKICHHAFLTEIILMLTVEEVSGFLYRLKDCTDTAVDIIEISITIDGL